MTLEKRLPFLASIISGLIAWIATLLFLRQYIGFMTIVLLVAIIFFRFEPWAFIGSFLIGLAIELYNKGATTKLWVVLILILGGSILQTVIFLIHRNRVPTRSTSTIGQNMVFAIIGLVLNRIIQFVICPPSLAIDVNSDILQIIFGVIDCHAKQIMEMLTQSSSEHGLSPAYWNTVALVCLRSFLLSPAIWAAFFAALRQIRFNILQLGRLFKQTIMAFIGVSLMGFITWIILIVFSFALFFISPIIPTSAQEIAVTIFIVGFLSIDAFFTTLGSGWAASWGDRSR